MKDVPFKGCGTALVTPFLPDGNIDYKTYAALVRHQVAAGVDFLVPVATTAETPALTQEEKAALMKITRAEAPGLPLIAGVGVNCVRDTLTNIELLAPLGADALLVVVPYYNKPTQEGQYLYFKTIAQSTDKPVIIYNVPGRTGTNMLPDTVLRLAGDCPNIVGIKEASGNYGQASEILRRAPEGFSVLSGDDDLTLALMATGAHGVISVASNAAPQMVAAMVHKAAEGNFADARELHHKLWPLFKACFVESNPVPVKAAMEALGLCSAAVRLPLSAASDSTRALMKKILDDMAV